MQTGLAEAIGLGSKFAIRKASETPDKFMKSELNRRLLIIFIYTIFASMNGLAIATQFSQALPNVNIVGISTINILCITSYAFINRKDTFGDKIKKSRIDVVLKLVLLIGIIAVNGVAMAKLMPVATLGWINVSAVVAIFALNRLTEYFQNKDPDYIDQKIEIAGRQIEALQKFQIDLQFTKTKLLN